MLKTVVGHNERWPRSGIMSVNHLLLSKGDELLLKWLPINPDRTIYVEFEKSTSHGTCLENIFSQEVKNELKFQVSEDGLYNLCIENPKFNEYRIGEILLFQTFTLRPSRNTFPERFSQYEIINRNGRLEKICKEWGYRKDIGAIKINEIDAVDLQNLKEFYSSSKNGFFNQIVSHGKFIDEIVVEAKVDEYIAMNFNTPKNMQGVGFSYLISKINSVNHPLPKKEFISFKANEKSKYIIRIIRYKMSCSINEEVDLDYELKLYSDKENDGGQRKWETVEVYNTVFNKIEKEIIKKKPVNNNA